MYISLLRHAESEENAVSVARDAVDGYAAMKIYVKAALRDETLDEQVLCGIWPSPDMIAVAKKVKHVIGSLLGERPVSKYELSTAGIRQAHQIGQGLQSELTELDVVFVSPYCRAMQTLAIVGEHCEAVRHARHLSNKRLTEKYTGAIKKDYVSFFVLNPWELVKAQQVGQNYHYAYQPPEGESSQQVIERIRPFVQELLHNYAEQHVLIVAHQVVLLAIVAVLEHKTSQEAFHELDTKPNQFSVGGFSSFHVQDDRIQRTQSNRIFYETEVEDV